MCRSTRLSDVSESLFCIGSGCGGLESSRKRPENSVTLEGVAGESKTRGNASGPVERDGRCGPAPLRRQDRQPSRKRLDVRRVGHEGSLGSTIRLTVVLASFEHLQTHSLVRRVHLTANRGNVPVVTTRLGPCRPYRRLAGSSTCWRRVRAVPRPEFAAGKVRNGGRSTPPAPWCSDTRAHCARCCQGPVTSLQGIGGTSRCLFRSKYIRRIRCWRAAYSVVRSVHWLNLSTPAPRIAEPVCRPDRL